MPRFAVPTLLCLAAFPLAAPSLAQGLPPARAAEFGCQVTVAQPCEGRVDFDKGSTFEFKVGGPGTVLIQNRGNRRCVLPYSATNSQMATTGRELNLTPGQVMEIPVTDVQGVVIRFNDRGAGSTACDLLVVLRP